MPGGIEPNMHLSTPVTMQPGQRLMTLGPENNTVGMAFGGTTTHIDFCFVNPQLDIAGAIARRAE